MTKDIIITLDNNDDYLLLDETIIDNKKYFFAVGVSKENESPNNEYIFIEEVQRGEKIFAKKVMDEELSKLLLTIFTTNHLESVEE